MRGAASGHLACFAAGAAMTLAFAPFDYSVIVFLSGAVLFWFIREVSPARAFVRGGLFGLGFFGTGVSWVQVSIHQFGLPIFAFSASVTALLVLYVAVYPALVAYCLRRYFAPESLWRWPLAAASLWTLSECLRGWVGTGFPWLSIGYSQISWPLKSYAPIIGVYGVGFVCALSAALISQLLVKGTQRQLLSAAILVLWGGGQLLDQISWTERDGGPLRAVLVQGGIPQAIKWLPKQRQPTLLRYLALTEPYWGHDLIVWPETAIPAFESEVEPFLSRLHDTAAAKGSAMLVGLATGDRYSTYYNGLLGLGAAHGRYLKKHLVPFGEYLPFAAALDPLLDFLNIPMSEFSAGASNQNLLKAGKVLIGASICYEDAFGEELIGDLPHAQLLVNVSNDAWFGRSIAPAQHLQIAQMRALETGRYLLRSTNTGISAIIDPRGRIMITSPQFEAHSLTGEVYPRRGSTPYVRFGNWPVIILSILVLLAAAGKREKSRA